jgi:hypothetical protein
VKLKLVCCALIIIILACIVPKDCLAQGSYYGLDCLSMLSVQPKVLIGYMFPNKPTTLSIGTSGGFQIQSLEQSSNLQGLWTELIVPIRCPSPIGFAMSLGYLFPANYGSQEIYNTAGGVAERTWATSTQMVNFQVAGTYRFSPSIMGILGFRYDFFMTNFGSPVVLNPLSSGPFFDRNQSAALTVTGDIPFFGGMIERDVTNGINLKAGAIGLPTLPGDISYREVVSTNSSNNQPGERMVLTREFRSGYFLEGFGELSIPFSQWFQVGAFAKFSGIYGKATQAEATYSSDTKATSVTANLIFYRSSWIFGGTISATF